MQQQQLSSEAEIGYVIRSRDYLIHLQGLTSIRINDIIVNRNGDCGLVTELYENKTAAVMLTQTKIRPGDEFVLKKEGISVYEPLSLLGKAISPLGALLEGTVAKNVPTFKVDFEPHALGINKRAVISEQLVTGITLVDTLLPLGKGQRQLLYGGATSGKTPFLLDLVINQNRLPSTHKPGDILPKEQTVVIYVAIGKPEIEVKRLMEQFRSHHADIYTILIASYSGEPAPGITLCPAIGLTLAEKLRDVGYNSVVILDDLGTQAKYIREIALLSEHVPGRESYPGDIFYQQAHLTERAGNFLVDGYSTPISITLLPVIEAGTENFSSLIPTNIMSTTDGHLLFSTNLRSEGRYPSIDHKGSVTRVGRQTQTPLFHELSDKIRLLLTEYEELITYSRFGADTTNIILTQGSLVLELIRQTPLEPLSLPAQAIVLSLPFTTLFAGKDPQYMRKNKSTLIRLIYEHPAFTELAQKIYTLKLQQLIEILNQDPFRSAIINLK